MNRSGRLLTLGLASLALVVVAAACGGDDDRSESTQRSNDQSAALNGVPVGAASNGLDYAAPSGINGGDAEFNYSALVWQGYWLSRDHFGPFVMASGAGIPFQPPMDVLQMGMQMIAQNPADGVMIPQNMAPLQAVFASAGSQLLNNPMDFEPLDFQGMRLDPSTFDRTIKVRGQAETMLKESQWAHNFADAHFGDPKGDFGAQQRFMGLTVNMLAQMQGQYAMQNLLRPDALYYDSDGSLDYTGNWVMLHALSDLAGLAASENGRYANPELAASLDTAATNLFSALKDRKTDTPQESAAAVRALLYRAWTARANAVKDQALKQATTIADSLVNINSNDVVANSAAIAALTSNATMSDGNKYRAAADTLFKKLAGDFDATNGVFKSKATYDVDDVAWIIGGLNSLVQQGNDATKAPASRMLLAFYESTISLAGLQLSAPPGKDGAMAGKFEQELPSAVYYHPVSTPPPPMARRLTVPGAEVTWDGKAWKLSNDRFVAAGAMHLANELNWLGPHLGSVPFPFQQAQAAPATTAAGGASAGNAQKLTAKGIKFDKTALDVAAGQSVTVTFDNQDKDVPHNLHIQAGAAGDFKTEIKAGPGQQALTFTISQPGSYTFICDVHPADMRGSLTVR